VTAGGSHVRVRTRAAFGPDAARAVSSPLPCSSRGNHRRPRQYHFATGVGTVAKGFPVRRRRRVLPRGATDLRRTRRQFRLGRPPVRPAAPFLPIGSNYFCGPILLTSAP